jgi:hypothetical protein
MTMEQRRGLTSSRRTVILLLYNKMQLFLVNIKLFVYSPVQSSLKHDEAMSEVPGDQNETSSCPEKGRFRAAYLPVVENRIRFGLFL